MVLGKSIRGKVGESIHKSRYSRYPTQGIYSQLTKEISTYIYEKVYREIWMDSLIIVISLI